MTDTEWPVETDGGDNTIEWEEMGDIDTFYELVEFVSRFSVFADKHSAIVLALWILHTHAMNKFHTTPRLIITSDGPGCGKTQVLDVAECFVNDPWYTGPVTGPTVKKRLQRSSPTLLLDETDTLFRNNGSGNEALREILNMGFKCNAVTSSVAQAEGWSLYIPVMLAGISGKMPKTVIDRAVTITLTKAKNITAYEEFEYDATQAEAKPLKDSLVDMMARLDLIIEPKQGIPELPVGVIARQAQVWRPLLAIAEAIGGDLPAKARAACLAAVGEDLCVPTYTNHVLLTALRQIFDGRNGMFTTDILSELAKLDEKWNTDGYSHWKLAADLAEYGVRARNVRINGEQAKGYSLTGDAGLEQAWIEYLF